jgi:phytoene dehydrogenase-like protein
VAWIRHDERSSAYAYRGTTLLRRAAALGFTDAPAFKRIVAELALGPIVRRKLAPADPLFQVALPGHRVDVRGDSDAVLAELAREFPEVRRAMEEFYGVVARTGQELDPVLGQDLSWPPDGFFERRESARALAPTTLLRRAAGGDPLVDFPAEHPFRMFVQAQARFSPALDPDAMGPLALLRAHGAALRGAAFFDGGRDGLQRVLADKIVQHGGDVYPRESVARIVTQRGRVRGVDLASTDERMGCSFVITSVEASVALHLAEHQPGRALALRLMARAPRYYRFVLNAVARAEGVPAGMGARVFAVMDRSRPLAEENLLAIETAPPDAAGRVVFTATALLPRSGVVEGEGYLHKQRARVLRALAAVVPFLRRNLIAVDSPHDGLPLQDLELGTDVTLEERWKGAAEPMDVVEAVAPDGFLGLCALPARTDVRGLLLVGRQVVPGLGEEGELLAALSAARIVTRTDRLKEKMRRELWSKVDA